MHVVWGHQVINGQKFSPVSALLRLEPSDGDSLVFTGHLTALPRLFSNDAAILHSVLSKEGDT